MQHWMELWNVGVCLYYMCVCVLVCDLHSLLLSARLGLLTTFALLFGLLLFQINLGVILFILNTQQFMMQYFLRNRKKHFFYIDIIFGWCFEQLNVHLFGKTLCIFCYDNFLVWIIVFITDCNKKEKFKWNSW